MNQTMNKKNMILCMLSFFTIHTKIFSSDQQITPYNSRSSSQETKRVHHSRTNSNSFMNTDDADSDSSKIITPINKSPKIRHFSPKKSRQTNVVRTILNVPEAIFSTSILFTCLLFHSISEKFQANLEEEE